VSSSPRRPWRACSTATMAGSRAVPSEAARPAAGPEPGGGERSRTRDGSDEQAPSPGRGRRSREPHPHRQAAGGTATASDAGGLAQLGAQLQGHLARGLVPQVRLLASALATMPDDCVRHLRREVPGSVSARPFVCFISTPQIGAAERHSTGEHLVEEAARAVDVAARSPLPEPSACSGSCTRRCRSGRAAGRERVAAREADGRAMPKSDTIACPFERRMFSGLMSRWMMPRGGRIGASRTSRRAAAPRESGAARKEPLRSVHPLRTGITE